MSSIDTPPTLPEIDDELAGASVEVASTGWLAALFTRHAVDVESSSAFLDQSVYYKAGHWDLPQQDADADEYDEDYDVSMVEDIDERKEFNDRVLHRFMDIFNDVIHYFGFGEARRALATEATSDELDDIYLNYNSPSHDPTYSTRPDLVILGQDAKQLPRPLNSYTASMSIEEEQRREIYRGCVSVGKVERCQRRRYCDRKLTKVANCARECFRNQPGRRFVYAFSVTLDVFQFFYFDRSGVSFTESVDIHKNAITFVQLVRFLANADLSTVGFDPKVYWEGGQRRVDIVSGSGVIKYQVDRVMSHRPDMFGSGTTCWVAREIRTKTQLLIKDNWHRGAFAGEAELLTAAKEAGVPGMTGMLVVDESYAAEKSLTTSLLRRGQGLDSIKHENRVFSRIVMELYGPSIRHFKSGLNLLQAFRDSIETHYYLVKAGVLHRDISANNIHLQKANPSGRHGILLNLAQGTRCERGRPAPENDVLIGTFMFRSVSNLGAALRKTLEGRQRHDFIDDLESFFWVYAWMTTVHNGPGAKRLVPESERTERAIDWEKSEESVHSLNHWGWKDYYLQAFGGEDRRKFTPYFSKPVYLTLLHSFRTLLYGYWHRKDKRPEDERGNHVELDFFPEMDDIYSKVLGFFDVAIGTLSPAAKPPPRTQPDRQAKLAKRRRDEDSIDPSLPKAKKARVGRAVRPKRQRDEDPTSTTVPKPKKARLNVPLPDAAPKPSASVPFNVRRSSRLKTGR